MNNIKAHEKGFTLIEMIASLLLVGIVSVMVSIGFYHLIEGFFFTRDNAQTALVAQTALTRLSKELSSIDQVSSASKTQLGYSYVKNGSSLAGRTLSWSGTPDTPLFLGGIILAENVKDFELTYHTAYNDPGDHTWDSSKKIISIKLDLIGASGIVTGFSISIAPRNI